MSHLGGPNEFPIPEATGGGGGRPRPRPNPELPPQLRQRADFNAVILQEILQIRDRLHSLESGLLAGRAGGAGIAARSAVFHPAEFPEGGGGGGGEIIEIADIVEIADIAEFPIQRSLQTEVAALRQELTALQQVIHTRFDDLAKQIKPR
jgi:hypothetical protein